MISHIQTAPTKDTRTVSEEGVQLVTVYVANQLFGIPILRVRDVFIVPGMTTVPLAPASVAGLFNLRGRVLTMLSLKAMLGRDRQHGGSESTAIGIEWNNEAYGLLVDKVGEVLTLDSALRESTPVNLDSGWASVSAGVYRLESELLIEISLDALFKGTLRKAA